MEEGGVVEEVEQECMSCHRRHRMQSTGLQKDEDEDEDDDDDDDEDE